MNNLWHRFAPMMLVVPLLLGAVYGDEDPAVAKEDFIRKLSRDISKVDHAIEVTKRLVHQSSDMPYLADLYFRLAELHVERSRYVFSRLMEQRPQGTRTLGGETALEVHISKRLAIEAYDKLLSEFPEYAKNDQVRFFKGHEFRELGEFDTMLKIYAELIDKHPSSLWAMEARLIVADYYFDKSLLPDAERAYLSILSLKESHLHDMARYKLGWIRINQERFSDALKLFEAAAGGKEASRRGAVGDGRNLDVKREALMALVWPFSEVKKAHQAPMYFRKLATSKVLYVAVLVKLANRYFVKTQYQNAAMLYRHIVPLSGDVAQNIVYVSRIYESVRGMSKRNPKRYEHADQDVAALVTTLAGFERDWRFSQEEKTKLRHDFEIWTRDLSTRLHQQAQRIGSRKGSARAVRAYREYLAMFPEGKHERQIRLNLASALHESGDYVAAALEHEKVAHDMELGPKQRDMVYDAIAAFHRALDSDAAYRSKHPTLPGLLNKLKLLRAREGMKQLGSYFVKQWPKDGKTPNVKFNIAKMYYQQGEFERASDLFAQFIKSYPRHRDVPIAGNLAMDALHQLDKLDELAQLASGFASNKEITVTSFKREATRIAAAARKRNVELTVITTSGADFDETMLTEWSKHKGDSEGEAFLYTAFVKYKNEGNIAGVYDFGGRMIGAYPKSSKLVDVLATMGNVAVRAADFERAALYFEEFQSRFPKNKAANGVLASAARIRMLLSEYEKAGEDFRLLRQRGNGAQRKSAHENLMLLYAEARNWDSLARVAQTALQSNRSWLGATFYLGLAYIEQRKFGIAERTLNKAMGMRPKDSFDKGVIGQLNFERGKLLQQRFDALQFKKANSAQKILEQKFALLEATEKAYVAAIKTGDGNWGIAGLFEAARAYDRMSRFIVTMPFPPLSNEEKQQVSAALDGQAKDYAQKAQATLATCKQRALKIKVFNAFARGCLTGQLNSVDMASTRSRSRAADDAYQTDIKGFREKLVKNPESVDLLLALARRAIGVGDYHLGKLTLSKALEIDPRRADIHNLLGVAAWGMRRYQEAYRAFVKGQRGRLVAASANIGALFYSFGYRDLADKYLVARIAESLDENSPDVHPMVRKALKERGGS